MILTFLKRLVAPYIMPIAIAASAVVTLYGASVYDRWIDDPAVRADARKEYVHIMVNEALKAQLAEEQRQREIAEAAADRFGELLRLVEEESQAALEHMEQEIADYEAKLESDGRSCHLDDADIEWLRKP